MSCIHNPFMLRPYHANHIKPREPSAIPNAAIPKNKQNVFETSKPHPHTPNTRPPLSTLLLLSNSLPISAPINLRHQIHNPKRFRNSVVHTHRKCLICLFCSRIRRDGYDGDMANQVALFFVFADFAGAVEAVHYWHFDVHEDYVDVCGCCLV